MFEKKNEIKVKDWYLKEYSCNESLETLIDLVYFSGREVSYVYISEDCDFDFGTVKGMHSFKWLLNNLQLVKKEFEKLKISFDNINAFINIYNDGKKVELISEDNSIDLNDFLLNKKKTM